MPSKRLISGGESHASTNKPRKDHSLTDKQIIAQLRAQIRQDLSTKLEYLKQIQALTLQRDQYYRASIEAKTELVEFRISIREKELKLRKEQCDLSLQEYDPDLPPVCNACKRKGNCPMGGFSAKMRLKVCPFQSQVVIPTNEPFKGFPIPDNRLN